MSASSVDALGYVAAVLTTSSFFPQALKTLRTRDTSGISLGMYLMFTSGVVVWAGVDLASQNHGPALRHTWPPCLLTAAATDHQC
jgi:MtN3 and saliva related transmembrane protein